MYARLSLALQPAEQSESSELRLQTVGGKSETEFVISRSLSSTAAKSKGHVIEFTSHRVGRGERGQATSVHPAAEPI